MIIAIDGPSGTGKSTVAKKVADKLGFLFCDTGAIYRCLAYFLAEQKISVDDESQLLKGLEKFDFIVENQEGDLRYFLADEEITQAIRQPKISELASKVSKHPEVRRVMLPLQRSLANRRSIVCEGRDIGTVVFPHAELKIFLTANEEIRAQRRLEQLKEKFPHQKHSYEEILKEMKARDRQDSERTCAPLKQAEDAAVIDTSYMTIEQVVAYIVMLADKRS